jgi:hypothetical protein
VTQPTTDPLRNLVDRAEHHGGLTSAEAQRLRDGIGQLYADLAWWKRLAQDARATEAKRTTERDEQQQRAGRAEAALNAVRALHRPVEYDGQTICGHCSGYADDSTDNPPQPHPCPTLRALDAHTNPDPR